MKKIILLILVLLGISTIQAQQPLKGYMYIYVEQLTFTAQEIHQYYNDDSNYDPTTLLYHYTFSGSTVRASTGDYVYVYIYPVDTQTHLVDYTATPTTYTYPKGRTFSFDCYYDLSGNSTIRWAANRQVYIFRQIRPY